MGVLDRERGAYSTPVHLILSLALDHSLLAASVDYSSLMHNVLIHLCISMVMPSKM
jgi:hypothetical protein